LSEYTDSLRSWVSPHRHRVDGGFLIGIEFATLNQCGERGVHPFVPVIGPPSTANLGGGSFFLASGLHSKTAGCGGHRVHPPG
jgi:hypothetical protein